MNRLESMAVLVSVVEAGSLSAASRKLGMPLPTVSRKVSELEAHVKARLLTRTTRALALTEAGQAYVEACKRILQDVADAEHSAAGEYSAPRGELTITAPVVFGRLHVVPVAAEFLRAYPDVDIRLQLADRTLNLFDEHLDLAVRIGELPDSSLVATRVGQIRRVTCASPAYLAAHGTPRTPPELSRHACVTFASALGSTAWSFGNRGAAETVPVRARLVVNTAESAIDAAIAGVGITRVLSYQISAALQARELAIVLRKFEPDPLPVSLVHSSQRLLPLKLRAFLDFAAPRLKARLR